MKIKIVTIREIADQDFDDWVKNLKKVGVELNGKELREKGKVSFSDDLGFTRATTTYEIVE